MNMSRLMGWLAIPVIVCALTQGCNSDPNTITATLDPAPVSICTISGDYLKQSSMWVGKPKAPSTDGMVKNSCSVTLSYNPETSMDTIAETIADCAITNGVVDKVIKKLSAYQSSGRTGGFTTRDLKKTANPNIR